MRRHPVADLRERYVDRRLRIAVLAGIPQVVDDSHDVPQLVLVLRPGGDADLHAVAIRIVALPEPACHRAVDDRYRHAVRHVEPCEGTPAQEADPQHVEVLGRHAAPVRDAVVRSADPLSGRPSIRKGSANRVSKGSPSSRQSRLGTTRRAIRRIDRQPGDGGRVLQRGAAERHVEREHVAGVEPAIDLAQRDERLHEQPGADQQHQRQHDLGDHQDRLQTIAPRPLRRSPRVLERATRSIRAAASAGRIPKTMPVQTDTSIVKRSTRPSRAMPVPSGAMRGM